MRYTEIFKLKKLLETENIPFEFIDRSHRTMKNYQICYPCQKRGKRRCSVVQGYGTYGENDDLLEIMGLLTSEERTSDSVCGWLTAENVFRRIKADWEKGEDL